uniref:Putative trypsin-like serine protease n=1 Tax=Lutzomyia longipalpis TaxID=7200 RepID=A0A1B0CAQ3_LUTLO
MKFFYLIVVLANALPSFGRIPMGNCDRNAHFFEFVSPEIGWVGIGAVNLGDRDRLDNITVSVKMEVPNLEDQLYLGEIRKLYFTRAKTSNSVPKHSLFYEIRLPADNPLPNIVSVAIDGFELCKNPVQSDESTKIHLGYIFNSFLNTEKKFSQIIHIPKEEAKPENVENKEISNLKPDGKIECGRIGNVENVVSLVLGGKSYPRGAWPWLISIYAYYGPRLGFQCGGTLISDTLILTAAHCFFDNYNRQLDIRDIVVILGQYNLKRPQDQGTQIVYPDTVNIHPSYRKRNSVDNDIAVIVLPQAVQFTTFIRPACLWQEPASKDSIIGLMGTTAGWGRDEHGNFFTEIPKKVEIPVVSDEVCLRSHEAFSKITSENTFCAGWRNGTDGPCNGDSGGGLIFNRDDYWFIRGVVSTSLSDKKSLACDQNEYVVFTDIVPYLPWVKSFSKNPDLL